MKLKHTLAAISIFSLAVLLPWIVFGVIQWDGATESYDTHSYTDAGTRLDYRVHHETIHPPTWWWLMLNLLVLLAIACGIGAIVVKHREREA